MITLKNIHKKFDHLHVLKGIDLTINHKEVAAIVGPSGAGKTTLLQIMGTIDKPDEGQLIMNDQSIFELQPDSMARFRNKHIGFVFQFHHLLPEFTALENVCLPAFIARVSKKDAEKKAKELLNYLGIGERLNHKPSALSGGEQQRVAVARALINNPTLVLADEPSGNLDSDHARELHQLFFRLRDELNQTFVIVTHNEELAEMADRKLEMKDGKMKI